MLPNGFKAQLAAHSRRATLRYRTALIAARDELVSQIERLPEATRAADPDILDRRTAYLVRASAHLDLLKAVDFVPVISAGTTNDEKDYEVWTDPGRQAGMIDAFTSPFPISAELAAGARPAAFLVVKSMLLTGFDAPVEQVLYLEALPFYRRCEAVRRTRPAHQAAVPAGRRLRPESVRRKGPRADRPAHDRARRRHRATAGLQHRPGLSG